MNGSAFISLFERLPGMLYQCNADKIITYISSGCFELTGYKPEELQDHCFTLLTDLVCAEDRERIRQCCDKEKENGIEYRITDRNGNVKWIREVTHSTCNGAGDLISTEGYLAEVPESKRYDKESFSALILHAFLKGVPDLLLKVNLDGKYVAFSDEDIDPYYQSSAGKDLKNFFPPPVAAEYIKFTGKAIESGQAEIYEYKTGSRENGFAYFESRFVKISSKEAIVVVRDITQFVTDKEQMRATKEFYEDVINSVNVDIAVLDKDNNYQLISKAAIKSAELRKWIIGKNDFDYSRLRGKSDKIAESRTRMYHLADELKQPVEWLEELEDESGSKRFFVRTLKPFKNAYTGYKVGYGMDVTALKVVQDELLRREHLLSFSHKLVKTGYWVYYPGVDKYEWSDGVYEILEINKNDILPSLNVYYDFIHPDDKETLIQYVKDLIHKKISGSVEFKVLTAGGEVKYIRELSSARQSDTEEYIFGVIQDITDVKKSIEERELLIKEINNKYNDLMQFSYIVSHNLRSPVANIIGMSSLLNSDLAEAEKIQMYDYIMQSAQSIDTVIRDLNHVLSTRNTLNEKREKLILREIIEDICYNLREQINESGASVILNIDSDANELYSIRSYVQSIFHNLISNSIKYKATSRAPLITISARKETHNILVEVSDNGTGIDLNLHKNQLFGLYKRFTTEKEGKGLGLHMTKAQVESLGGSISVESEVGTGTIFKIVLK